MLPVRRHGQAAKWSSGLLQVVRPDRQPPDALAGGREKDAEPVSETQAADRAREAVRKAIADIRQIVIP
jgi:hypothetical protein